MKEHSSSKLEKESVKGLVFSRFYALNGFLRLNSFLKLFGELFIAVGDTFGGDKGVAEYHEDEFGQGEQGERKKQNALGTSTEEKRRRSDEQKAKKPRSRSTLTAKRRNSLSTGIPMAEKRRRNTRLSLNTLSMSPVPSPQSATMAREKNRAALP